MHVKHKKVLWESYNKIKHEIETFDRSTTNPNRQNIWDWNPLIDGFSIDDGRMLLVELAYLSNLHLQVVNDQQGCLIKPDNFYLTIGYMKNILDFKIKTNPDILKIYKGKDKSKIKRQLKTEINGLEYYIDKLKEKEFLDSLPGKILTFSQKYDKEWSDCFE